MGRTLSGAVAALLLAGCSVVRPVDTVDVHIPVPEMVLPPADLLDTGPPPAGAFVAPGDPAAVLCLAQPGKLWLGDLITDQAGLTAWAADPHPVRRP